MLRFWISERPKDAFGMAMATFIWALLRSSMTRRSPSTALSSIRPWRPAMSFTISALPAHGSLWTRGLRREANLLFNRYLDRSTEDGRVRLPLMPLFMSIRATIRAHVLATLVSQGGHDEAGPRAAHYLASAEQLLAEPLPSSSRSAACLAPASRRSHGSSHRISALHPARAS